MTRTLIISGVISALVVGCSKDEIESEPGAVAAKTTSSAPGVSATSQSELGPQHNRDEVARKDISVTSKSKEAVEHFMRGRELVENIRQDEARKKFEKAIELDPNFALAYAYLGELERGKDGLELIEKALELADTLPPAERLVVKRMYLTRVGDRDSASETVRKLTELAPGDFRVQVMLARERQEAGDLDSALRAYEAATKLNPKAAEPYNYIAYLHANKGRYAKAIKAARTYAALKPDEPNPHDSLGEIMMMAGELEGAEAAFLRAVEIEPSFVIAWEGVAYTRFYRDDWEGGIEALEKSSTKSTAKGGAKASLRARENVAWALLAAGDSRAAFKTLDGVGKDAKTAGIDAYSRHLELVRAEMYLVLGKASKAKRSNDAAVRLHKRAKATTSEEFGWVLVQRAWIQAELGDAKAATKSLAQAEEIKAREQFAYGLSFARGVVAMAGDDAKTAVEHFGKIGGDSKLPYALHAQWMTVRALDAAGKSDEAARVRDKIAKKFQRNLFHAVMRKRLTQG